MEKAAQPYGYIYRITSKVNGKVYIGKHLLKNEPWRAYLGSGVILSRAIRKHGRDSFTKAFLGYAWSAEELSALENEHISHLTKNHYNIHGSELNSASTHELSADVVLSLYRSGQYSTNDLADVFQCAQSTIARILKEYRGKYPDLAHISQGRGIKPVERSPEATDRLQATYKGKVRRQCDSCGKSFLATNIEAHVEHCSAWPRCAVCGVQLSKRSAVHCRAHFPRGSRSGEGVRGKQETPRRAHGSHVRWHVSRGKYSPKCLYCNGE